MEIYSWTLKKEGFYFIGYSPILLLQQGLWYIAEKIC